MATDCISPILDSKCKQAFRRRLLAWYAKHERDLPWRKSQDPYRVWISEVMLQQTQVETVKPYFLRFLKAFPTVKNLAAAEESQVLRLWEGLGYYRRARGLHAAAKKIVAEHGGQFPRDVATLQTLPGIGRYTAGAIASIAFNQRAPILEANTIRLLARLLAYPDDPTKSVGQRLLWAMAEEILPRRDVARFNQALMELGSLVCTPTQPKCDACPVARNCAAFQEGLQNEIPRASVKMKFTDVREAVVVVRKNGKVIMRQCGPDERWAGLWDFPRFGIESEGPLFVEEELVAKVRDQTGITAKPGSLLTTIKHGVTRYRITLDCYTAQYKSGRLKGAMRWIRPAELAELPLSTTGRKLANRIIQSASGN
ncbi:A/G-specific adenine glycosylase [Bythopirellula goksoeyrii]|uniref:Adenine DNA glycosylase n=1 Tax=Bythopirellula goksoeyrii TaxID=1400387 RepID=A0A5B9Q4C7_9BACT|nr:A/G-specific adenine glycosylase [Bythopirellula goksoeyrii]QEG33878.1 putative A/G-specific adenine glycosylase YfhQ [Bythopirellula goksoeyrii]